MQCGHGCSSGQRTDPLVAGDWNAAVTGNTFPRLQLAVVHGPQEESEAWTTYFFQERMETSFEPMLLCIKQAVLLPRRFSHALAGINNSD